MKQQLKKKTKTNIGIYSYTKSNILMNTASRWSSTSFIYDDVIIFGTFKIGISLYFVYT
jgi:hypothetical protein